MSAYVALVDSLALLATILTVLLGLWMGEIRIALAVPIQPKPEQRRKELVMVDSAIRYKTAPLAAFAFTVACIMLPPVLAIVGDAYAASTDGFTGATYDPIAATFVLVYVVVVGIGVASLRFAYRLNKVRTLLEGPERRA